MCMQGKWRCAAGLVAALLAVSCSSWAAETTGAQNEMNQLFKETSAALDKLRPQSIRPAEGYIKYDYLIPAGFYKQMWDWDGFFIGIHLAARNRADAKYLKWWTLNFALSIDAEGYVPGCITSQGPRPVYGKFAMKPFLAQGAYFASKYLDDFTWIEPVYENIKKVLAYRERTQFDPRYGLFFWDNAGQSGADNNPVLSNDENDKCAILAADINTFQLREYKSMIRIAGVLKKADDAKYYTAKAQALRQAMMKYLWFPSEHSFFNVRRDTGAPIKRVSYSNFVPLLEDLLPKPEAAAMITGYLLNKDHMRAAYGLRSLSKQDPDYNNAAIIKPYSNWQGPVWINANFMYALALKRNGFDQEADELARVLGTMLLKDMRACGSMHENYHADTGAPLAPTAEQSENGVFTGFVGWNMLIWNMLEGAVERPKWIRLDL